MSNSLLISQESPFLWYNTESHAFSRIPDDQKMQSIFATLCGTEDLEIDPQKTPKSDSNITSLVVSGCNSSTIKNINIIFHFILRSNGTGNFDETSDGLGNSYSGYERAEDIIAQANTYWANNQKQWLPAGNSTPIENTRIRYVLKGTYFHRSDYYYNNGDGFFNFSQINNAYGIDKNSTINVYIIPPATGEGSGVACGIGTETGDCTSGRSTKIYEDWGFYQQFGGWSISYTAGLLNHEVGHLIGLFHTWDENDQCGDTPFHNNCWEFNPGNPNCDNWNEISNNLMDYNAYAPAVTPCQITKVHNNQNLGSNLNNFINSCSNCIPSNSFFTIDVEPSLDCILAQIIMDGTGSYNENQYRIEIFEVAYHGSTTPISGTLSEFSLLGSIGVVNLSNYYQFHLGKLYRVRLRVKNSCSGWDEQIEYVSAYNPNGCYPNLLSNSANNPLVIFPNPSTGNAELTFSLTEKNDVTLSLHDRYGNIVAKVMDQELITSGSYTVSWKGENLENALYYWVLQIGDQIYTQPWIIDKSNH